MLQEENDVKDAIAASSSKLELGFHPKIHQIRCQKRIGNTSNEEIGARSVAISIGISPALLIPRPASEAWSVVTTNKPKMTLPPLNPAVAPAPWRATLGRGQQACRHPVVVARLPSKVG